MQSIGSFALLIIVKKMKIYERKIIKKKQNPCLAIDSLAFSLMKIQLVDDGAVKALKYSTEFHGHRR